MNNIFFLLHILGDFFWFIQFGSHIRTYLHRIDFVIYAAYHFLIMFMIFVVAAPLIPDDTYTAISRYYIDVKFIRKVFFLFCTEAHIHIMHSISHILEHIQLMVCSQKTHASSGIFEFYVLEC